MNLKPLLSPTTEQKTNFLFEIWSILTSIQLLGSILNYEKNSSGNIFLVTPVGKYFRCGIHTDNTTELRLCVPLDFPLLDPIWSTHNTRIETPFFKKQNKTQNFISMHFSLYLLLFPLVPNCQNIKVASYLYPLLTLTFGFFRETLSSVHLFFRLSSAVISCHYSTCYTAHLSF